MPQQSGGTKKGAAVTNILLVHCHYRLPGGEDAVFAAERELLRRHGHTVTVYERSNEEAASGAAKLLLPFCAVYNRRAAREIRQLIQQNNIELVHIHNTLLLLSPAVLRAAKAAGVPVVQSLHNFRLFCPNGVLLRGGTVCEDCPHKGLACAVRGRCYRGSTLQSAVVAFSYGLHRAMGSFRGVNFIALTEFDRRKLLEFNTLRPTFEAARLFVKPNPVGMDNAEPLPWSERKNQLVYAGRLEELKGLPTVLKAWQLLGKDAPQLLVAGSGPLAEWAAENATDKVTFLGRLSPEVLRKTMGESRAVLAASLCYESFALVPAEALAAGTPVLASDIGNVGASVEEGVSGLHFAPGDAAALAAAVQKIIDPATRFDPVALAQAARARYNEEANYAELMAIYEKAARSAPSAV